MTELVVAMLLVAFREFVSQHLSLYRAIIEVRRIEIREYLA